MDPCRRIWFTPPLALFGQLLSIVAIYALLILAFVFCS